MIIDNFEINDNDDDNDKSAQGRILKTKVFKRQSNDDDKKDLQN